jgi:hypothetical protein
MRIRSGSATCSGLVLGWEGHAASSCFVLMAMPGGQIQRWWLRARTVEAVWGLAERLGGRGGLGSFPLPPFSQHWWADLGVVVGAAAGTVWQRQETGSSWRQPDSIMVVAGARGGDCGRAGKAPGRLGWPR